jgi:N-methylhydantoinase A
MGYIVGIDTGGTFTDVVVIDGQGQVTTAKALTTPPTFAEGIMNGLEEAARLIGQGKESLLKETDLFILGTTIATNTLIMRSGAKVGLIATLGHEHVHHLARGGLSKWIGRPEEEIREAHRTKKVEPLIPKSAVRGVPERIDWKGSVVFPLDLAEAREAVQSLVNQGVQSIAVCLLWSFSNPAHEIKIKEILEEYPHIYKSISHELEPSLGEYARTNTALIDGYVGPAVKRFFITLNDKLQNLGLKNPMLVMQAHGGSVFATEASPYATFQSGPCAGVIASKYLGEKMGYKNIINADVGGTSFDVSIIQDGLLTYAREPSVARFLVSFPMVDVVSIGAGGGSIAWYDPQTKLLRVGPQSAGSNPGPACYGFGGVEPTVTDAALVLGYLNPEFFLGGKMKLYPEKAFFAVKQLADQLGWDVVETAAGIYQIVNNYMADTVRAVTIERGFDPREFVLFAYGGAGPMHAAVYGEETGVKEVIVPSTASTLSAFGLASTDILHNHRKFYSGPMPMDPDTFNKNFDDLEQVARGALSKDGIEGKNRIFNYAIDMRWGAQYYTVRMPIKREKYDARGIEGLCEQFDELYERLYGKGSAYTPAGRFVTSFIVDGIGKVAKPVLRKYHLSGTDPAGAFKAKRSIHFSKFKRYEPTSTFDYELLEAGNVVEGPAIIEAPQTTIVIPPGQKGRVDEYKNIVIK